MSDAPLEPPSSPPPAGPVALVVLAAGQGSRMRSRLPKPLHPVAGLPMAAHVLRAGAGVGPDRTALVVGAETADLAARLDLAADVVGVRQDRPRGTGDAVRLALADPALAGAAWIVVLYADHPLLTPETVARLLAGARASGARLALLSAEVSDAAGYGRVERDGHGRVVAIVERADDDPARRHGPTEINSGMMALDAAWARRALADLRPSAATGELYLTDLVALAVAERAGGDDAPWPAAAVRGEPEEALGINDRVELATADAFARDRIRRRLQRDGVTLIGPETIFVDEGVAVGRDTTILPFTSLRAGTTIGADCLIGPHATIVGSRLGDGVTVEASTVEDSTIADGADVGPYAHLRAGTEIGPRVHVGNYAELKNARLGEAVRAGHFCYLGDVTVGAETNIGAGTITANFDGERKHATWIGARAFIGSDAILRAPVRIGDGARIGAGSVVTRDVPDGALAVGVPARIRGQRAEAKGERTETNGAADNAAEDAAPLAPLASDPSPSSEGA